MNEWQYIFAENYPYFSTKVSKFAILLFKEVKVLVICKRGGGNKRKFPKGVCSYTFLLIQKTLIIYGTHTRKKSFTNDDDSNKALFIYLLGGLNIFKYPWKIINLKGQFKNSPYF